MKDHDIWKDLQFWQEYFLGEHNLPFFNWQPYPLFQMNSSESIENISLMKRMLIEILLLHFVVHLVSNSSCHEQY